MLDEEEKEDMTVNKEQQDWEIAEGNAYAFLCDTYGEFVSFSQAGGSDSSVSDIGIDFGGGVEFYIEVKKVPSRAGQFSVRNMGDHFELSSTQKESKDGIPVAPLDVQLSLLSFLNLHYWELNDLEGTVCLETIGMDNITDEEVCELTLDGELPIELSQNTLEGVREHYLKKGAGYMMVCEHSSGPFHIFPVNDVFSFLEAKATFRRKGCGSGQVPSNISDGVMANMQQVFGLDENRLYFGEFEGKHRLMVWLDCEVPKSEEKFLLPDYGTTRFNWSKKGFDDESGMWLYEITKLSESKSWTVEYSVLPFGGELAGDASAFEAELGCYDNRWYGNLWR